MPKPVHNRAHQVVVDCLHAARRKAELTQTDLANALGVDQSYVSKYERGERRLDLIEVRAICRALNVEVVHFVEQLEAELRKRHL